MGQNMLVCLFLLLLFFFLLLLRTHQIFGACQCRSIRRPSCGHITKTKQQERPIVTTEHYVEVGTTDFVAEDRRFPFQRDILVSGKTRLYG